jgi:hypothetical protein
MSDDTQPDLQMPLDELQVPHSERFDVGSDFAEALRPVNWNPLTADEAYSEWHDLDKWVKWLRKTYGLPPPILPPFWHRHDELIWELSALHPALEGVLRLRGATLGTVHVAPRLRRGEESAPRVGVPVWHPARPGPADSPDGMAR